MKKPNLNKQKGFTLIELLIVVAILGITMGAIYSLYTTHQRSAYVSDEVVEVQQNLRIGLTSMTRDIRMAGFMVPRTTPPNTNPLGNTPVDGGSTASEITINIGSSEGAGPFAVIAQDITGMGNFIVTTDISVDQFVINDVVTIIRPNLNNMEVGGVGNRFDVVFTNRATNTIQLADHAGNNVAQTAAAQFIRSDLIVKLQGVVFPNRIRYCLGPTTCPAPGCPAGQQCLMKIVNGGAGEIIAQNIAPAAVCPLGCLRISYLFDDSVAFPETVPPAVPATANFSKIRAVRVTLDGRTASTTALSDNVAKQRQVETIIQIRNKFDDPT